MVVLWPRQIRGRVPPSPRPRPQGVRTMLTKRSPSLWAFFLCLAFLLPTAAARAGETKRKKRKPAVVAGSIEVKTHPYSYPIIIDRRPAGRTTEIINRYSLPPGPHAVEI